MGSPSQQNNPSRSSVINQSFKYNMKGSKINEQASFSLSQSVNNQGIRNEGVSPKNIHQLQSKTKLSISSPMSKIDEIMLTE